MRTKDEVFEKFLAEIEKNPVASQLDFAQKIRELYEDQINNLEDQYEKAVMEIDDLNIKIAELKDELKGF